MRKSKIISTAILKIFLALVSADLCFAFDDGFASAKKIEGKYFTLFYSPELKPTGLDKQLNITRKDQILVAAAQPVSANDSFSEMIDTLFLRVSDLLDMHLYSFHGEIKVCKDYASLNNLYKQMFNDDLDGQHSFYIKNLNIIYISAESCTSEVIGREMVYAILSQYFKVQTPITVQNVLANYVESQLRDNSQ
jgi:hypothetical protein